MNTREEKMKKLRAENTIEVTDPGSKVNEEDGVDINEGQYWHADKETVVKNFVSFASRIFRNFWVEEEVCDRYPIRDLGRQPVYPDIHRECLRNWLVDVSEMDYADDFVKTFRDFIYESWMPSGARQETMRYASTKYDVMNPLNLLEKQIGVDSTVSVANMARVRSMHISKDPKSQVYEFLLFAQIAYAMKHDCCKTDFAMDYFLIHTRLHRFRKRLEEKTSFGQPRRPILLRLKHAWYIHDVENGVGELIHCVNLEDAVLKFFILMRDRFNYRTAWGISLQELIIKMTMPIKIESIY